MLLPAGIDGLLHPLVTPDHVIALTSLGLVAGRNTLPVTVAIVAAFALGIAIGLGALASGAGETPAGDVLLAVAALCGLIAATGVAAPVVLAAPVALASGVALGLDSPPDSVRLGEAVAMLIGTACGSIAALAVTALLALTVARLWQGIALRVAGSWIAAIAILALAVRWAP
jgi:urease accessory protein